MASVVGICNSALIKLGASPIMALTEGSKSANLCNEQYVKLRDDLLRAHSWNFAIARARLARLSEAPAFGPAYAYQLPADWLRTVGVYATAEGGEIIDYRIEGRALVSDAEQIYLRYVRQVADPNEMTSGFREALAWNLAQELAIPIVQSSSVAELMARGFEAALVRARSVDSLEDVPEPVADSDWLEARQ